VFQLNLTAFLVRSRPSIGQPAAQLPESEKRKIRSILSILLTWGLNEGIDEICKGRLNIVPSVDVGVGYSRWLCSSSGLRSRLTENSRSGSTSLYTGHDPASGWRVSPEQSASRALAILACLQVLSRDVSECIDHLSSMGDMSIYPASGLNQDVEVVSTFYATSLADLVGEVYHSPSLSSLAIAWVRYPGAHPLFRMSI